MAMPARGEARTEEFRVRDVYFQVRTHQLATILVGLPVFGLLICLTMSLIFLHEKVIELECGATNLIPSISAITGIYPLSTVWKSVVALQCSPRIAVGIMYRNFYEHHKTLIDEHRSFYKFVTRLNFILYLCDNLGLIGISYMTNKDNYWLHEKIFIVFMFGAVGYNIISCFIWSWLRKKGIKTSENGDKSFRIKQFCTLTVIASTIGLLYYFYRHRRYCLDGAFSRFCICEYLICVCNMAFHYTAVYDFPNRDFINGTIVHSEKNGLDRKNK